LETDVIQVIFAGVPKRKIPTENRRETNCLGISD
jgi:hypothetical protein